MPKPRSSGRRPASGAMASSSASGSAEPPDAVMKRPSRLQPWPIPEDLRCSPVAAVLEALNKPRLSKRQRDQEAGFVHMEQVRMARAHKESAAQETIAQLQVQARQASGQASASSGSAAADPSPPKFATGQSVLHWWSSWMEKAETPPKQLKKKARPAWFDATIVASVGIRSVRYAGFVHENIHCYQVH